MQQLLMLFLASWKGLKKPPLFKTIFLFYKPFLKRYWRSFMLLFMMSIIWSIAETVAPYCIKMIIDDIALYTNDSEQILRSLINAGCFYMVLMVMMEGSLRLCHYIWIQTLPKVKAEIRDKSLQYFQEQPFGFLNNIPAGKAITQYRHLSHCFEKFLSQTLYGIFPTIVSSIAALLLISHISTPVALLFGSWYCGMNFVTYIFAKKSFLAANSQAEAETKIMGHVGDLFRNDVARRTVPRSLCPDPHITHFLQRQEVNASKKLEWLSFKTDFLRGGLSLAMLLFMMVFLMVGWQKKLITLGDFSFITAVCFYARRSAWMASIQLLESFKILGIVSQSLASLSLSDTETPFRKKGPQKMKGDITVENLCFGYTPLSPLFHKLSLHIQAGEKVALTGGSGIGKTSLMHLLLAFHQLDSGKILFDGVDQATLRIEDLQANIAYVPQMMTLFHRTIRENIIYGNGQVSEEEILKASSHACCHEFIKELPKGYDTVIGEDGINLSGGQRQRIALARALLKDASILILDESFSALDHEKEAQIIDNILTHHMQKTLLLISHRNNSVEKMERRVAVG